METGTHDGVIPSVPTNVEKETEEELYKTFEETNWWARSWLFSPLFFAMLGICFMSYALTLNLDNDEQVRGLLGLTVVFLLSAMAALVAIKYFAHDRPWKKFATQWTLPADGWTTNIGDVLKIYD